MVNQSFYFVSVCPHPGVGSVEPSALEGATSYWMLGMTGWGKGDTVVGDATLVFVIMVTVGCLVH